MDRLILLAGGVESVRFAFIAGIAVSLLMYERWNLTAGSVVVPGYLAIALLRPAAAVTTLLVAGACHVVVNKFLAQRMLLFGRTKFTVLAVTSTAIALLLGLTWSVTETAGRWGTLGESAGFVIPALIAHDMGRQGVRRTLYAASSGGAAVLVAMLAAALLVRAGSSPLPDVDWALAFDRNQLPLAVVASVGFAWLLQSQFGLRSGGFVGGAYVALLSNNPGAIGALITMSLATYLIVTRVGVSLGIQFGRRKFASMLIVGSMIGWLGVLIGPTFSSGPLDYGVLSGFALAPLILPGLLANDMERTSPIRVLFGTLVSTFAVLGTLMTLHDPRMVASVAAGLALAVLGVVVARRLAPLSGAFPRPQLDQIGGS